MSDTPTTNYATLNPISVTANLPSGYTKRPPFDGNLSVTFGQGQAGIDANFGITPDSGKFYWEVQVDTDGNNVFTTRWGVLLDGSNYDIRNNQDIASVVDGDILGFALDANAGTFNYYHNGTLLNNEQTFPSTWKLAVPWMGVSNNGARPQSQYTFNFGQRAFEYTPPTDFLPLNTANLAAPSIKDGSDYFNTVLYTGNASTQSITGVNFQPDLTWIKSRDAGYQHVWTDVVRGVNSQLASESPSAEETQTNRLTSFDSDGFSLGSDNSSNASGVNYVAWCWKAGGSGSSNTDGSITSTVSVNPSAGFSIVSYTGTGVNATVGHGLGVAPKMVIVKRRDSAGYSWNVYHESTGNTGAMYLDAGNAFATDSTRWNNTSPTSTVFSIGSGAALSGSGGTFIAYCFAEVPTEKTVELGEVLLKTVESEPQAAVVSSLKYPALLCV